MTRRRSRPAAARNGGVLPAAWGPPAAHAPVVVHGFGRQFRTLNTRQAEAFWAHARQHFLAPGHSDVAPDQDGLTYAAQVWSHSGEQLLGFVEYC